MTVFKFPPYNQTKSVGKMNPYDNNVGDSNNKKINILKITNQKWMKSNFFGRENSRNSKGDCNGPLKNKNAIYSHSKT